MDYNPQAPLSMEFPKQEYWSTSPSPFSMEEVRDFPGGLVVNNPPATGGDSGSGPGQGRSHTLWDNEAQVP